MDISGNFCKSLRGIKMNKQNIDLDLIHKKILIVVNEEFKNIKELPISNKCGKICVK
uniref:Uncharacterized protein n=1 Tax=viral metagenome TaxID=1070528 RepID=A0A6C0EIJ4_9ZZZZ